MACWANWRGRSGAARVGWPSYARPPLPPDFPPAESVSLAELSTREPFRWSPMLICNHKTRSVSALRELCSARGPGCEPWAAQCSVQDDRPSHPIQHICVPCPLSPSPHLQAACHALDEHITPAPRWPPQPPPQHDRMLPIPCSGTAHTPHPQPAHLARPTRRAASITIASYGILDDCPTARPHPLNDAKMRDKPILIYDGQSLSHIACRMTSHRPSAEKPHPFDFAESRC
jgi:hypothetical protein